MQFKRFDIIVLGLHKVKAMSLQIIAAMTCCMSVSSDQNDNSQLHNEMTKYKPSRCKDAAQQIQ